MQLPVIQRSSCSCSQCRCACETMPGYLVPEDLEHLPVEHLRSSSGALVIKDGVPMQIPTIVPASRPDGSCVFYANGKCTVHAHSPWGCRAFNVCETDTPDVQMRRQIGLALVYQDHLEGGPYHQLTKSLPPAEDLGKRKQRFLQRLAVIERKQKRRKRRK